MMFDEPYNKILLIPIAQILSFMGFETADLDSLNLLVEIFKAFVIQIGEFSHQNAEMAGRTESNFHDIRMAFLDSGVAIENLINFSINFPLVSELDEIPPMHIDMFDSDPLVSYYEKPLPLHIPDFLPCFPNSRNTPIYSEVELNPKKLKELKTQIETQAENNIANLRQYVSINQEIVNYDQVNDPKIAQNQSLLFKPAKDCMDLITSMEREEVAYSVPATSLPKEKLLKHIGNVKEHVDEFSAVPQVNGPEYDNPVATKILSLRHKDGILTLSNF